MANTSDSFIEEVTEEVRRERLFGWLRRWGWAVALALLFVVGGAAWLEWRESQDRALAELRGEAILATLEIPDGAARLAALEELPREGEEGIVAALLLAADQEGAGDAAAAAATLDALAADGAAPPLYRDLAALKAQMARGLEADAGALEGLAAPGAPFRLLAMEQLAMLHLARGEREAAAERLRAVEEDAELGPSQRARVEGLLQALSGPLAPPAAPDPGPAVEAPADAGPATPGPATPGPATPGPAIAGPATPDPGPAVE